MSFLDSIAKYAPTIGGVLGGIGGEIIDPFGGGVIGAGLGSALGKGVENYDQGKGIASGSDITSDLGAGAEGAIGQGAGDLLGGAIGAVGGLASKYGAGAAEKEATGKAAQDLVNEWKPVANTPEFKNYGNSAAIANEANVPATAQNFSTIGHAGTGQNGLLNTKLDNIVNSSGNVDMSKLPTAIESAIAKNKANLAGPTAANSIRSVVMDDLVPGKGVDYVNAINEGINPAMVGAASGKSTAEQVLGKNLDQIAPQDSLTALRNLRQMRDAAPALDSHGAAVKNTYNDIFNAMRSNIYDRPEINSAVAESKLTPEEEQALLVSTNGDTNAANYLRDSWNKAQTASEVNVKQADLINMRDLGDRALQEQANRGQLTEAQNTADQALKSNTPIIPTTKEAALGHVVKQGTKASGPIATRVGSLLERISPFTGSKGIDEAEPMLHTGILNKVPGALGTTALTSPNVAQGATAMNPTTLPPTNAQPGAPGATPGGQISPYDQIIQMMGTDPFLASSLAPMANTLLPTVQKAQTVESQLPALQQSFQQAGGAQGPLGGLLAKIGSAFGGGETAKYTAQQKELMTLLQGLGISPANVPSITESPQAAQAGLGQIQGGLSGILGSVPAQ